jgi:hypothetical protein
VNHRLPGHSPPTVTDAQITPISGDIIHCRPRAPTLLVRRKEKKNVVAGQYIKSTFNNTIAINDPGCSDLWPRRHCRLQGSS